MANNLPASQTPAEADEQESDGVVRYNGLKNQGSTCYLNTVLQCLYMTEDFRTAVERFKQGPNDSCQGNVDLLLQLQKLFGKLKKADGTTKGITQSLHITNVYKQQDAVEYYQKILKAVGIPVSQVFEGKMSNKSKCQNDHIFQEKCSFITIPLAIDVGDYDVYNVEEGLKAFFKPLKLDEDNWLYCDGCDQKTESETWSDIDEIPTVLTLHLKRFDFDYMQMKHVKNHCAVDVPLSLHVKDNEYDLYAVMNHRGDQNGGHYNAVIKSFEDDEWYCFDDNSVMKVSKDSLQNSQWAYLLMYRQGFCVFKKSEIVCDPRPKAKFLCVQVDGRMTLMNDLEEQFYFRDALVTSHMPTYVCPTWRKVKNRPGN